MQRRQAGEGASTLTTGSAASALASYHALLQSNPGLARETHNALVRAHEDRGLKINGRMLCNVLRPRFISVNDEREIERISAVLCGLLERAGEMLLASDRLMDRIGATDQEREIWSIDPGYVGVTLTSRLDSFFADGRLRFIEYNAESPASIGFCDSLSEVFTGLPVMRDWQVRPKQSTIRAPLLDLLLETYREWGGIDTPTIAVIDWDNVITKRDFELCAEYFREHDVPTVICDPRALEYHSGKLLLGNQHITLVYRRVLLHELLDKAHEARPLLDAYRDGAVCMINSPRSKLLHKKIVFAFLSDRSLGLELTPEEQQVVDNTVPWTRCLVPGATSFHGENVDLNRLLLTRKDLFVAKPVDDYGGRGVSLGWETSDQEWERALEAGAEGSYIVQERVDIPKEVFPVWREDRLQMIPFMLDTNPLMFRGKVGGILTRTSSSALLNVTAGTGSTTPTFALREEA